MTPIHNQERLVQQFQSATAYLETIREMYQRKEAPLELVELLQAVIGVVHEIRREVLTQELRTVLNNEALPAAIRKAKEGKRIEQSGGANARCTSIAWMFMIRT